MGCEDGGEGRAADAGGGLAVFRGFSPQHQPPFPALPSEGTEPGPKTHSVEQQPKKAATGEGPKNHRTAGIMRCYGGWSQSVPRFAPRP